MEKSRKFTSILLVVALLFSTIVIVFLAVRGGLVSSQNQQTVPASQTSQYDIDNVANKSGYTIFAAALQDSGLDKELSRGGPYTIFVPSNQAFRSLSKDEINKIETDPNVLKTLVLNHVVRGAISENNLKSVKSVVTLDGNRINVGENGSAATVGGQTIVNANTRYSNGVLQGINGVILP